MAPLSAEIKSKKKEHNTGAEGGKKESWEIVKLKSLQCLCGSEILHSKIKGLEENSITSSFFGYLEPKNMLTK